TLVIIPSIVFLILAAIVHDDGPILAIVVSASFWFSLSLPLPSRVAALERFLDLLAGRLSGGSTNTLLSILLSHRCGRRHHILFINLVTVFFFLFLLHFPIGLSPHLHQ